MKCTLSELTIDGKGTYGIAASAVDYDSRKQTYLRITDINDDGTINFGGLKSVDAEDSNKYILKENDIVFARTGASIGRSYFYQKEDGVFVYAGFLIKYSLDPQKVNPRFLKYYTHSKLYYDWVHSFDSGATRGNINAKTFGDMLIELPDRKCQDKIVSILKALDDKIAVNRRICENLEAQAQALFKHWFIDFAPFKDGKFVESELGMIPEGWRVGTLFDIADVYDSRRKPLSGMQRANMEKIYPYYGATDQMDMVDSYIFDGRYVLMGEDGSVVRENGLPYIQYVWGKIWVNNHAHVLSGKDGFTTEMLIPFLTKYNIKGLITGAVQAKLNQASMANIKIAIPPINILNECNGLFDSIYAKYRQCKLESSRLSTLRDTLLPKLMSGQIKL